MSDNTDYNLLFAFLRKNDSVYNAAATQYASKLGISKMEADLLIFLYENSDCKALGDVENNSRFNREYLEKAAESLITNGLAANSGGGIMLTGKGGITAKSLTGALKRQTEILTGGLTPDEKDAFYKILRKISAE